MSGGRVIMYVANLQFISMQFGYGLEYSGAHSSTCYVHAYVRKGHDIQAAPELSKLLASLVLQYSEYYQGTHVLG